MTLGLTMLKYFVRSRDGCTAEEPLSLSLRVEGEEILVRPDDVLVRPDGGRIIRRVRTGHIRSFESKDVGAAALLLAVRQAFPGAVVELVHLSDGASHPIALTIKELQTRRDKLGSFLRDIRAGRFPSQVSSFTCPGCPAFFICGPIPQGPLQKKFT